MVEPYRDRSNSVENRVEDLLARLTLPDKAGLMFHDIVAMLPGGQLMGADNPFGRPATDTAIQDMRLNHFNLAGGVDNVRDLVAWHNHVQELARSTGPGIPVTVSTDPRHSFSNNPGTEALAGAFSQWPQSLGFAALGDADLVHRYADIARQEYLAAGIRVALHPQIDLATEPRWARIGMTFGEDADLTSRLVVAYIRGFQGAELGPDSVATMTKHFPGGGPQKDGEDPHFAYGREQVYPGGQREYHLKPFLAAIAAGTSQMMPYYGMPVGTDWEEVGFAFSHAVITELLRNELGLRRHRLHRLGFDRRQRHPGSADARRAWGAEHLSELDRLVKIIDAGCDQFGGESRPELVIEAVRTGRVSQDRIHQSVRRLLREKFVLGLFDQPFLDLDHAVATIGRTDFVAKGEAAQRAAIVRLTAADSGPAALPLGTDQAVYVENIAPAAAARLGRVVEDPADADLAVLRINAPFEPRPAGSSRSSTPARSSSPPPNAIGSPRSVPRCRPSSCCSSTVLRSYPRSPAPQRHCSSSSEPAMTLSSTCCSVSPRRRGGCRSTSRPPPQRWSRAAATSPSTQPVPSSASVTA